MNPRENMKMKNLIAGVLSALLAVPAGAEPLLSASVEPVFYTGELKGNRGLVMEYDGRQFTRSKAKYNWDNSGAAGKLSLGTGSDEGYFGFGADYQNTYDGSVGYQLGLGKAWRMSGEYDSLMHRQPFTWSAIGLNGAYYPNPVIANRGAFNSDFWFQRQAYDLKNRFTLPTQSPVSLFFDYWRVDKEGDAPARLASTPLAATSQIRNTTQDFAAGAQVEVGKTAGVDYEHLYRTFEDNSQLVIITNPSRPRIQSTQWNVNEVKFRCSPSPTMAFTGTLANSDRKNEFNGYRVKTYSGSLAGSFAPAKDLSLTARLYSRGTLVRENQFLTRDERRGTGDDSQVDKNTFRGDFQARYRLGPAHLKGNYRLEYNTRRGAPVVPFDTAGIYQDGLVVSSNTQATVMAAQDTKHILSLGLAYELPLDIEIEAEIKRLIANRPVFDALPNWQDTADLSLAVPLPKNLSLLGAVNYLQERNNMSNLMKGSRTQALYMAGLSWMSKFVSLGADYQHENARTYSEGYFGATNYVSRNNTYLRTLIHDPGMYYKEINDTLGGNVRVALPKGIALKGQGSFTRSVLRIPVNIPAAVQRQVAGEDHGDVTDLGPSNVGIYQLGFGVEYHPEMFESFSAKLGYRTNQWSDKNDSRNNGRVNVVETSLSAKF